MPHRRATVRNRAAAGSVALATALAFMLLALPAGASAKGKVVWLCRPGAKPNPCMHGQRTTMISHSGQRLGGKHPLWFRHRKVDCFYVYPTVSDQETTNANLQIDPEERSIALYQAARYSQLCRVYAPMYRQVTLKGISDVSNVSEHASEIAYKSALRGWKAYLRRYNDGRGVVLIGHSQGTFVLTTLIANEIDSNKKLRRKLVSAILLGGNVTVADGSSTGGDFDHIRACHSKTQLHCVVAFSTFDAPVPSNSIFGRTSEPGQHVLCTNPAALGGGSARLRSIQPSKPFAPDTTIGAVTPLIGFPTVHTKRTWVQANGAYSGRCSSANGANVLQIQANHGAPELHSIPDATWGLHLIDANIALGNLVGLVRHEIRSYIGKH
jgi:hypothetical protein